ncbi:MAG: hydroxyisourate hydrolase [Bacteroidota bacterium]|nr:hydroxyisourate hydrolase [Bacteroidota bacterium]
MSTITTHILDTSIGKPAEGIAIILYRGGKDARLNDARPTDSSGRAVGQEWEEIARTKTNADGRATDLTNKNLDPTIYKLRFETKDYFDKNRVSTFYPYVEIIFEISDSEHYHVPLLLNAFGYSTYRGS